MDFITTAFVLFLFCFAIFFTLIIRRDWLAREELERQRRRRLYASRDNAQPRPPARGVRPAPHAAPPTPGRIGRQHFDPGNGGPGEATGEARVTDVKGGGEKLEA